MAKLGYWKNDRKGLSGPFLSFDRFSNFGIFYPILMKLVSYCTNSGSRNPFLGSKYLNFQWINMKFKIRFFGLRKTGLSGKNEFSGFHDAPFRNPGATESSNSLELAMRGAAPNSIGSGTL